MNDWPRLRPMARRDGLLVEELGAETVIYDTRDGSAHCLGPLAAAVFAHCDGRTSAEEIAGLASASTGAAVRSDEVLAALAQLEERELLEQPAGAGSSRRELLRNTAVATAAVSSISLMSSIVTPASAASCGSCLVGVDCTAPGFKCGPNPPGMTCKCGPCRTNGTTGDFVCSLHNTSGTTQCGIYSMGGQNGTAPCCPCTPSAPIDSCTTPCNCSGC